MPKSALFAFALVALTGCHHTRTGNFQYVITPDTAAQTLTVSCDKSSTDKCHFAFTGDVSPAEASVRVGETLVFHNVTADSSYCAENHKPSLETCQKGSVPLERQTISKEFSSDQETN
jgi:hypothetical protein